MDEIELNCKAFIEDYETEIRSWQQSNSIFILLDFLYLILACFWGTWSRQ
jgi:hypothetical protein